MTNTIQNVCGLCGSAGGSANLCMHLCTRSLTTLRERSTRQMCPPWLRLPPRTAPMSTSSPSQRSPCPSPNNLADPVRNHRRCLQIGPASILQNPLFLFSPSSFLCCTPSHPPANPKKKEGWTVCENSCPAVPFSPHSSCDYIDIDGFCSCHHLI